MNFFIFLKDILRTIISYPDTIIKAFDTLGIDPISNEQSVELIPIDGMIIIIPKDKDNNYLM